MKLAAFALAVVPLLSLAAEPEEEVRIARSPNGDSIELYAQSGPCAAGARVAVHIASDGARTPGCYKVSANQDVVGIVWFDTDTSAIPARAFHVKQVL